MKRRGIRGSNQYRRRDKERVYGLGYKTWRDIIVTLIVCAVIATVAMHAKAEAINDQAFIAPIPYLATELDENSLPVLTPEQQASWEAFKRAAHKLAPLYNYPAKVVIAQAALESARGTSRFAQERNNYFGFTCYDRDPEKYCAHFDSIDEGIIEYLRLIKYRYPNAYAQRANPDRMIELIHKGGFATDPDYVAKIKSLPEWRNE